MRILLTNDDGLHAPGIEALYDALIDHPVAGAKPGAAARTRHGGPLLDHTAAAVTRAPRSLVSVVAPADVQSATSHGVTFHKPIMVTHERVNDHMTGHAVEGRPADCVKLAIANLWPDQFGEGSRPDLLISGMNAGANCGINVIYSGTVAAALEGAFLGIPAIAVSMLLGAGTADFQLGAFWARKAIEKVIAGGLPARHACISINVPRTDQGQTMDDPVPPIRVCPMNCHGLMDRYEKRLSPSKHPYYWAAGYGLDFRATDPGSDVELLLQGCITVTPLRFDMTQHAEMEALKARVES